LAEDTPLLAIAYGEGSAVCHDHRSVFMPVKDTDTVYYFGYGSLVNRETRAPDEPAWNARLSGWRRAWEHRVAKLDPEQGCTSLSIAQAPAEQATEQATDQATDQAIDGVLVALPRSDLPQLDQREHGYERLELPCSAFSMSPDAPADIDRVYVYRSLGPTRADVQHPILLSYVECVMAGYLARFGWPGVKAFLSSTDGWRGGLLDERTAPQYPRAVNVEPALREEFDRLLASVCNA